MTALTIRRLCGTTAVALLLAAGASAAQAADLIVEDVPVAVAPVTDWTGFYAGVHLGYGSADVSGEWAGSVGLFDLDGPVQDYDMTGGFVGGQLGFNYQLDSNFVVGLEGSLSLGDLSGGEVQFDEPGVLVEANSTINWFGSVVARGGVAVSDDLLLYGTVGLAWANVDLEVVSSGLLDAVANDSQTHFGPTVGIGAELKLDEQWSVGADLRYAALGEAEYTDPAVIDGSATLDLNKTTLSLRLNYAF